MTMQTLKRGTRAARKPYRCQLCNARIRVGDRHHVQTNVYDQRVYDWRDCLACERDRVLAYVYDWTGGYHDEGVDYEAAVEWAQESVRWSADPAERRAARAWLARAAGGEGE